MLRCPKCGRYPKRTNQANKLYWSWIHAISEQIRPKGEQYSPEAYHLFFKGHFLGIEELKMPNGRVFTQPKSSADLDKDEFSDYTEKVIQWATEHGVFLEGE